MVLLCLVKILRIGPKGMLILNILLNAYYKISIKLSLLLIFSKHSVSKLQMRATTKNSFYGHDHLELITAFK